MPASSLLSKAVYGSLKCKKLMYEEKDLGFQKLEFLGGMVPFTRVRVAASQKLCACAIRIRRFARSEYLYEFVFICIFVQRCF